MNKLVVLILSGVVVLVAVALYLFLPSTRKLDEVVFHEGPGYKLKLVRYYENMPMHYVGEVFTVQCSSAQTASWPAQKTQDAGWRTLGNGGAIDSKSAQELVARERQNYLVVDDKTLVWIGMVFNISFDACGHFAEWNPTSLPKEVIDPVEKPSYCGPQGTADCRHYDFMGDRQPQYEMVQVMPTGKISFLARSKTFRPEGFVEIESLDHGKTWQLKKDAAPVPGAPSRPGLMPCPD